jgi:hypothetical protein
MVIIWSFCILLEFNHWLIHRILKSSLLFNMWLFHTWGVFQSWDTIQTSSSNNWRGSWSYIGCWCIIITCVDCIFGKRLSSLLSICHESWWWSELFLALSGIRPGLFLTYLSNFYLIHQFFMCFLILGPLHHNLRGHGTQLILWLLWRLSNLRSFILNLLRFISLIEFELLLIAWLLY